MRSFLLLLLTASGPALAGKAEQKAEINRLLQEIDRLAEKNAWSGVERAYLKLVSLDRRGAMLEHETHLLGATAAQSRGDTFAVYQRLERALEVDRREETLSWLATLVATNTKVSLEISPLVAGDVPLESIDPVIDPAQVKVIEAARAALAEKRYFEGLLPMGRYRFGDKRFDVYGQEKLELTLWPGENKQGPSGAPPEPPAPTGSLVLASTRSLDGAAYETAADGVRFALAALDGVQEVVVRPLPPLRLYADFDASTLDILALTTGGIAEAVSEQLGIPLGQVAVRPTSISVPHEGRKASELGAVKLPISDGEVALDAIGSLREAPDRTAATPGLEVKLADGADLEAVRARLTEVLAASEPAQELGLSLE